MRGNDSISISVPAIHQGVCILDGYGLHVSVRRNHLRVSYETSNEQREGRLHRATNKLQRLVVMGAGGMISFEALRLLHDVGAAFVQIGRDGEVITASAPDGLDDARLRRAQATAPTNGQGIWIGRELVRRKLAGQAEVLDTLPDAGAVAQKIRGVLPQLDRCSSPVALRSVEAQMAADYRRILEPLPLLFAKRDLPRIPAHWLTMGTRTSPLTNSPRLAVTPAHAMLNLLYGIGEIEARIACRTMGLDSGMGVIHVDQPARDSMALDLLEVARPKIDLFLLGLLKTRTFRYEDFGETRQGVCRVLAPLSIFLVETAPRWAKILAPVAEWVANALMDGARQPRRKAVLPTPLTQAHRSRGRDAMRRRPRRETVPQAPRMPRACRVCGVLLDNRKRHFCDDCSLLHRKELVAAWSDAGQQALARLRVAGTDPAHGGQAGYKRGRRNAEYQQAAIEWERHHQRSNNVVDFRSDILTRLRDVPLAALAQATGFSLGYCSLIRRGLRTPHQRHWDALRKIAPGGDGR